MKKMKKIKRSKNFLELRPDFGNYKKVPYLCDIKRGYEFWYNHLKGKIWFKSIQKEFKSFWLS